MKKTVKRLTELFVDGKVTRMPTHLKFWMKTIWLGSLTLDSITRQYDVPVSIERPTEWSASILLAYRTPLTDQFTSRAYTNHDRLKSALTDLNQKGNTVYRYRPRQTFEQSTCTLP